MKASDQSQDRAAAAKFIDGNGGPGRYFAVIDYAGTLRVTQNFTDDTARLKQVVSSPKLSTDSSGTNASLGSPVFSSYDAYSNRNVLLALRSVARSMASLPGRKSLIWLTSGFPLTQDNQYDLTSLISACNRANVAVYPVDVRGLSGALRGTSSLRAPSELNRADAKVIYTSEALDQNESTVRQGWSTSVRPRRHRRHPAARPAGNHRRNSTLRRLHHRCAVLPNPLDPYAASGQHHPAVFRAQKQEVLVRSRDGDGSVRHQ